MDDPKRGNGDEKKKKPKLRSSKDVFNYLKWGSTQHNSDNIFIGYWDRFTGMKEIKFGLFQPDLQEEGGDIPFHRVWYFREGSTVLWDRASRYDGLFSKSDDKQPPTLEQVSSVIPPGAPPVTPEEEEDPKFEFPNVVEEPKPIRKRLCPPQYAKFHVPRKQRDVPVPVPRTQEELEELFPRYPTDDEGYLIAFTPEQKDDYMNALKKYGFVAIHMLDKKQCQATILSMQQEANDTASPKQICAVSLEDPKTWDNINWPSRSKFLFSKPCFTQAAFENRTNPILYDIFCTILDTPHLYTSIDHWGIMRGTTGLKLEDEDEPVDKPEWGISLKPHFDLNPWRYMKDLSRRESHRYQALVALVDCPEEVGGISSTPGCLNFLASWTKEHIAPHNMEKSHRPHPEEQMSTMLQRCPIRRGVLFIWDSGQLHATWANTCNRCRLYQFVRMMPAHQIAVDHDRYAAPRIRSRYNEVDERIRKGEIKLSDLGKKLLGLEEWKDE